MSNDAHLEGLNDPQKEAVTIIQGPLLVLAGAGSGKTRVITHRIVHLILGGVAPHNILAVTFTNKSAKEMRERVHALIKKHAPSERAGFDSLPTVTTFHSLGVRILREHHQTLNLRRHFIIYDRADSNRAIKKAIESAGHTTKEFEPRKMLSMISRAKGDAITRVQYLEDASSYPEKVCAEVWKYYDKTMQEEHALDFDDLLFKTLHLLESYPVVLEVLQKRYQYIHVDEYQDTNKVQFAIIKLLTGKASNICVVGDVDQNIYSWRGADIKNVLQFENNFPGAKTIFLEENYRSTGTIIAASNSIIEKNNNRIPKTVFTSNQHGEKITLHAAHTGPDEAEYIVMKIKELMGDGASPSSFAILYRTNFQSRVLEEAFLNFGVPYQLLGTKFFERKEVKDVLSYLRLALNPGSTADIARIVNVPTRGIGKVTMLKMVEGKRDELKGATLLKVERFEEMMRDIGDQARTEKISETLKFIIKRTGIEADLRKHGTEDDMTRLENLQELVTLAIRYDELGPEEGVEALIENAALQSDQDELQEKEESDAVRLMTIHSAKGLEFPYVFITGLEEGLFPHERLGDTGVDHEEERRLFYVALTRAEKKLFLTYAHVRMIFGQQRVNVPSSFLNDISNEHVEADGSQGGGENSGYEATVFLD
ncbi:MAG: DNA helicase-2/ATP-dependent DNA helicase PcrA [Acidimicrobiales bacterium]|jgi:DNA helicase-2/ATP-dependent DNA helicase PcrA